MNILEVQNRLKNFSQEQLVQEMQRPSGQAPQFLVLSELQRRKQMQADFAKQQSQQDQTTVAQDAVAAAGVPQGGIAQMARSMAPKTNTTQNTGIASVAPQGMKSGGAVRKMAKGGVVVIDGIRYIDMGDGNYVRYDPRPDATVPLSSGVGAPLSQSPAAGITSVAPPPMQPPAGIAATAPLRVPKPEPFERMTPWGYPTKEPTSDTSPLPPRTSIGGALANDAITQVPPPSARPVVDGIIAPQYAPDTVFDPMTGAVISGGDVIGGPAPGPSTGDWFQDLIQSEATKQAVQDIRDKQAGAPPTGPAGAPLAATSASLTGAAPAAPIAATSASLTGPAPTSTTPSGGGGGAGVPSAGAPSDYETELMSMLKSNERKAEQDKWLTLAQFGLQLMAANSPSLAGSIGQAGQNVIPAYQESRDANEAERMKLLGALEESRMARQAMAMRAASAGGSAGPKPMPATIIAGLQRQLSDAQTAMASLPPPVAGEQDPYAAQRMMLQTQITQLQAQIGMGMSQYGVAPLGAPTAFDFDATQPG